MKTVSQAQSPIVTMLRAAKSFLSAVFDAPPQGYRADQIAALVAASSQPSGA